MCTAIQSLQAQEDGRMGIGDVTRALPYAAVIGMKACGADSRDGWNVLLTKTAAAAIITGGAVYTMKETIHEWRPDMTDRKSFPSGHTAFAFAGATVLHHEYGHLSPWISIAGYATAAATAVDRVCRDRHHWYDTAAGAAVGFLSAELGFFITDRIFPKKNIGVTVGPTDVYMSYTF